MNHNDQRDGRTAAIGKAVRSLFAGNRVVAGGGHRYTRPAQGTYPHQWLWDSCFHARIHHMLGDRGAAHDELRALFRAQVASGPDRGRLPHMTFFGGDPSEAAQDTAGAAQYARDVALWGDPIASSITQPPIVAETVLEVGEQALWRELWPAMAAYYDWWLRRRDPRGDGLLICHHVWETGVDASPRADAAAARLVATGRTPRALDKGTINLTAKKRTDLLTARFLMLEDVQAIDRAELDGSIDEAEAARRHLALYGHVAIDMQAHLVANLSALARIGEALGQPDATTYAAHAARIADAVNQHLWDDQLGFYVDRWGDPAQAATALTHAPFLTLAAADLVPRDRAERLLALLLDPAHFGTRWPVPTASRQESYFDPDEYWRGSTWINTNWFVVRGLCACARRFDDKRYLPPARSIAERTVALVEQIGFREYYRSGARDASGDLDCMPAGFGPDQFSWSGLVLDLARALDTQLSGVEPHR